MISLSARGVGAVLLDIEGTTTPIAFVYGVLFPYARTHLPAFLAEERHDPEVRACLASAGLAEQDAGSVSAFFLDQMDRDVKSPALKTLQGLIWERGYRQGELRGQVFSDVAPAIRRWRAGGLSVAIYSSGSELAQRRLFESTPEGDLTTSIDAFFDTRVGPKMAPDSYRTIAARLRRDPAAVLFVSDVTAELGAAANAGMQTVLSIRPGNAPQPDAERFDAIATFNEIE